MNLNHELVKTCEIYLINQIVENFMDFLKFMYRICRIHPLIVNKELRVEFEKRCSFGKTIQAINVSMLYQQISRELLTVLTQMT